MAVARGRRRGRGAGRGVAPAGSGVSVVDLVPPVVANEAVGVAPTPAQPATAPVLPGATAAHGVLDAMTQVLSLLRGLAQTGDIPVGPASRGAGIATPDLERARASGVQHAVVVAPRLHVVSGFEAFPRPVAGPVMTSEEHDLF